MKLSLSTCVNDFDFGLFEFVKPKFNGTKDSSRCTPDSYARGVVSHICVMVSDVKGAPTKALEAGGSIKGESITLQKGWTQYT